MPQERALCNAFSAGQKEWRTASNESNGASFVPAILIIYRHNCITQFEWIAMKKVELWGGTPPQNQDALRQTISVKTPKHIGQKIDSSPGKTLQLHRARWAPVFFLRETGLKEALADRLPSTELCQGLRPQLLSWLHTDRKWSWRSNGLDKPFIGFWHTLGFWWVLQMIKVFYWTFKFSSIHVGSLQAGKFGKFCSNW